MRVAIYARYSTDLQSETSIEDQVRVCREYAQADTWEIVQIYSDAAASGGSLKLRPGMLALLEDASRGRFDLVLSEALDRLSRDQEDIAAIFKRLQFAGTQMVTLAEGEISELHIGLKGTMNALFLKDLADKTRRGLRGRIEAGLSAGGKAFGYDVARQFAANGSPLRGRRSINLAEADVVRRIFSDYANGLSPKAIARQLNAEGIPGPSGRAWGQSTINGNRRRGTGLLNNELYIGRQVWNRLRYTKDPRTGKRVSRLNPDTAWITQDLPELRIIDQDLWDRVKERQGELNSLREPRKDFWTKQRPRYLLSGLIRCAACGGGMSMISRTHLGCSNARNKGTCVERRAIKRDHLEDLVLDGLKSHLMDPDLCEVFAEEYARERSRLQQQSQSSRSALVSERDRIEADLDKLVDALCAGVSAEPVKKRMQILEQRKANLDKKLAEVEEDNLILHPNVGRIYRSKISRLTEALNEAVTRPEAIELLRRLIDAVVVGFDKSDDPAHVTLHGDLAGILSLSQATKKAAIVSDSGIQQIKLVAGVGFEPTTFRL